jgi:hypothetical protein
MAKTADRSGVKGGNQAPSKTASDITVIKGLYGQFRLEEWPDDTANFDAEMVSFSGYFGLYGPHVFRAAPDLQDACMAYINLMDSPTEPYEYELRAVYDMMRAAAIKAQAIQP